MKSVFRSQDVTAESGAVPVGPNASGSFADAAWVIAAVDRFERPLMQYAARVLGDADRACDVVQDTFLKLWQADRTSVDGHLGQWLFRVCRNRALDVRRKEQRMTTLDEAKIKNCEHQEVSVGTIDHEAAPALLVLLARLPERQEEVLRLKFQGGLSYQEIGEVMGITANHVGVLIHTALKTLRAKLNVSNTNLPGARSVP